jgi:hypothetical protein
MKTNREDSLAAANSTFSLPGVFRPTKRPGVLAALIVMLLASQPQPFVPATLAESPQGGNNSVTQQWSLQIDKVDPGDVSLEPSFRAAIYENLLEEIGKTKQFKQLLRSGDRNANDVPMLLNLKTTVQKYTPGSETRRAVTTVTGATKLSVRIQLFSRDGRLVLEHVVEGDVRFIGSNLRATHNLAHHAAVILERSALPDPGLVVTEQETGKMSKY